MAFVQVYYIPLPYNVFNHSSEGQLHKKSKLENITNVGKIHLCTHSQKEQSMYRQLF